jgi:hypothetical protein
MSARITSQDLNQAIWQVLEDAGIPQENGDLAAVTLTERMTRAALREVPPANR